MYPSNTVYTDVHYIDIVCMCPQVRSAHPIGISPVAVHVILKGMGQSCCRHAYTMTVPCPVTTLTNQVTLLLDRIDMNLCMLM